MWYAVSEILFFLLIALLLGGVGGYMVAQGTPIRIGKWTKGRKTKPDHTSKQLSAARAEITHLQRLVAETDAKSGATGTRLSKRVADAADTGEADAPDAEAV